MLFLLLLGSTFFTYDTGYQKLADHPWSHCHSSKFQLLDEVELYDINYTYCSHDLDISPKFIDENIRRASVYVINYIDSLNYPKVECNYIPNLNIYNIELSTLNDPSLFYKWRQEYSNVKSIVALYDPRPDERNVASIMITDQGSSNELNFAHEISHYWHDRLCIGLQDNYQTEPFALKFEEYYKQQFIQSR